MVFSAITFRCSNHTVFFFYLVRVETDLPPGKGHHLTSEVAVHHLARSHGGSAPQGGVAIRAVRRRLEARLPPEIARTLRRIIRGKQLSLRGRRRVDARERARSRLPSTPVRAGVRARWCACAEGRAG